MKQHDLHPRTAILALSLLMISAVGCKSSDGDDEDSSPTATVPNHCTLSVRGDAEAGVAEQSFEATYGETGATGNNLVTANYYANSSNIFCGHLDATQGPDAGFQATVNISFYGKKLTEVAPITLSDETDNFMQAGADYREYTGDKRWWYCHAVHTRVSQGLPTDGDQSVGSYSFTLDSAEVYNDQVPGGGFNYTIHGSGSFTCAPSSTKDGTKGLVTLDVTF